MAENTSKKTLEEILATLLEQIKDKTLTIKDVLEILSGKGRIFLIIILSLPFCQPIQIPGFSTPFGILIAFIGLRSAFGEHIWLPKKLMAKTIPSHLLEKIASKSLAFLKKIKRWVHPRFTWCCRSRVMQITNGILIALLGIALALPLPIPLTNLAAGWSLLFISVGLLEDDGLLVCIGYFLSIITFVFFILIVFFFNYFIKMNWYG